MSWLPGVCSRELLEPSATRREKSMDVSFGSTSCSVREVKSLQGVLSERVHIWLLPVGNYDNKHFKHCRLSLDVEYIGQVSKLVEKIRHK